MHVGTAVMCDVHVIAVWCAVNHDTCNTSEIMWRFVEQGRHTISFVACRGISHRSHCRAVRNVDLQLDEWRQRLVGLMKFRVTQQLIWHTLVSQSKNVAGLCASVQVAI